MGNTYTSIYNFFCEDDKVDTSLIEFHKKYYNEYDCLYAEKLKNRKILLDEYNHLQKKCKFRYNGLYYPY